MPLNVLEVAVYAVVLFGNPPGGLSCESSPVRVLCNNGVAAFEDGFETITFSNGVQVSKTQNRELLFSNGVGVYMDSAGWLQFSNGAGLRRDRADRYRFVDGTICDQPAPNQARCHKP